MQAPHLPQAAGPAARLGAVVVLFHPSAAQLAHLIGLRRQVACLVAVDNTPEPDAALAQRLAAADIGCIDNRNLGGIAGAFNRGVAHLAAQPVDAFVLLDQDSEPPEAFFDTLARVAADRLAQGETRFLLGPRIYDVHAERFLPALSGTDWTVRRVPIDPATSRQPLRCDFMISSGCVVSRGAWQCLGDWREDYVIDHVDTEYSLRASRRGVGMWLVPTLTLRHAIGRRITGRAFGLRISGMNHDALRRYYLARNGLALAHAGHGRPAAVLLVNLVTLWQLVAVWLVEPDKALKTRALLAGLFDGLRGRGGPVEALRPRLAERCLRHTAQATAGAGA